MSSSSLVGDALLLDEDAEAEGGISWQYKHGRILVIQCAIRTVF
jgi:hypothetical protein